MDFVARLPPTKDHESIWVIVDRLTKSAHFIPMKMRGPMDILAHKCIDGIVKLHGIPYSIVSDRDMRFVGRFWVILQEALGTTLCFNTAYRPQTDGQTEWMNQTMEDMLRACVLDFGKYWENSIHFCEFSYNSYHSSIKMAPFEALYGRKYKTLICWEKIGVRSFLGPSIISDTSEKVKQIIDMLKIVRNRQKSYADLNRRDLEFKVGDKIFLKVSPTRGTMRFGHKR